MGTFNDEFKRIRQKLEMTQEAFATLMGLSSRQAVNNIERGRRNPSELAMIVLGTLDGLPKAEAEKFVRLMLKQAGKLK